ncbi:MAG TPA: hypothetical protein VJ783_27135, partial [Pirellulales bacterium]|nr:hypothetical protein [Pirellulales bacterium]
MQIFARRELAEPPQGSHGPCGRPPVEFADRSGSPGPCGRPPGGLTSRAQGPGLPTDEPALLLEGSWPDEERGRDRWSLDDAIDSRFAWIDRWAAKHAERLAQRYPSAGNDDRPTLAYLNELALRYFLVKLLRVVAFFDEVCPPTR